MRSRNLISACAFLACATAARAQANVTLTPLANGITTVTTSDGRYLGHLVSAQDGRYIVERPKQGASIILYGGGSGATTMQGLPSSTVASPPLAQAKSAHSSKHIVPMRTHVD